MIYSAIDCKPFAMMAAPGLCAPRTIPIVQGFFAREGFKVVEVLPDGYGPGFDRVTMNLHLDVKP